MPSSVLPVISRSDDGGNMGLQLSTIRPFSASRRMFCLLVLFDFLFTLIVWIIYAHGFSSGLKEAFNKEVENYDIHYSLFDVLILTLWRDVILILAYALYRSEKTCFIAVATLVTTAFLVAKVCVFDFNNNKKTNHPMDYIVVIMCLVMSWVETWHLSFKVLTSGTDQRNSLAASLDTTAGETRPLLYGQSRYNTPAWLADQQSFYTPYGSLPGSDDESDTERETNAKVPLSPQDQAYCQKARKTLEITWNLMNLKEGWKLEKDKDGARVESRMLRDIGKMFRVESLIDANARDLFNTLVHRVEDQSWNPNIVESKILHKVDHSTDICYNLVAEAAGGLVSPRDFINLRHWTRRGRVFISCNISVTFDAMPPRDNVVRGENGPGGWIIRETMDPDKAEFIWLVNTDLKGWLPQYLIDQAMTGVLHSTALALKQHVSTTATSE